MDFIAVRQYIYHSPKLITDIKSDIIQEECRVIWYLRNLPKKEADEFIKNINGTYWDINRPTIEFKDVIGEPFDCSKVDFTKKCYALDQRD